MWSLDNLPDWQLQTATLLATVTAKECDMYVLIFPHTNNFHKTLDARI